MPCMPSGYRPPFCNVVRCQRCGTWIAPKLDLCEACETFLKDPAQALFDATPEELGKAAVWGASHKVDEETTALVQQAAMAASAKATQDAWAAGLSITVMEEGRLISIAPDGTKTILRMD